MTSVQFSRDGLQLLQARSLNNSEVDRFAVLLGEARKTGGSAQDFLSSLSKEDLKLVQKANSLADPIQVSQLSAEGAQNLLARPDGSDRVDLNNDGIVEVGIARNIQFPPANAPQFVKDAWEKATEGMTFQDKFLLEFSMHTSIYGVQMDGIPQKTPLSPQQQWSTEGIDQLFSDLYGNLEFRVGLEGWTEHNQMLSEFYQDFEMALTGDATMPQRFQQFGSFPSARATTSTQTEKQDSETHSDELNQLTQLNQLVLDARMGIDRKKLEEIDEQIKLIETDPSLTKEQKQQKIKALLEEKQRIIEEAQERTVEEEKRKATLNVTQQMTEGLQELDIREKIKGF